MRRLGLLGLGAVAGICGVWGPWTASTARACGGTFCDANLPMEMPVEQTGENILFVLDGDFVEAHVQIQYDGGDATQFGWIVPVTAVPEIEVGSWRFVQNVLDATVPVYGYQNGGTCNDDSGPNTSGIGFIAEPDGGGGSVDVVAEDVVGAFQYVVLTGENADVVMQWLADNGYAQNPQAPDILDAYIAEGHVFVAFKLRHGALVEDIHPVVIRYPGNEPCIPLRLTRVAAIENMNVRALFLGDTRVFPVNYRHVLLNRVRLDWIDQGDNYNLLVSRALDEAEGRAFVTEYAGPSDIVATGNLQTDTYDASAFVDLPPIEVVDVLSQQGLGGCTQLACAWEHELVPSLLHEFLPVPDGMEDHEFYGCLSCNALLIDQNAWDGAAFAQAYQERIVDPLDHARDVLGMWPHITRLFMRISPDEMLTDPVFEEVPGLEDVANRNGAQLNTECCEGSETGDVTFMRLPGGREVWMPNSGEWPDFSEAMPFAERIEEFQPGGPPATLLDNTSLIDQLLVQHNTGAVCDVGGSTSGDEGPSSDEGGPGSDGTVGGGTTGGDGGGAGGLEDPSGCGCRSTPAPLSSVLGLGVVAFVRRRRR